MLIYILVMIAAVVGLAACYRAFGGGQSRLVDAASLLVAALASLDSALEALDAVVDAAVRGPDAVPEDTLRTGRKTIAQAQHCIDLLPGDRDLDVDQQAACSLLTNAVEDLGWAWRIVATATWVENDGLQGAVSRLRDHATRCRDDAVPLLPAPAAEPVEGPA
jgi:hypothetical protein